MKKATWNLNIILAKGLAHSCIPFSCHASSLLPPRRSCTWKHWTRPEMGPRRIARPGQLDGLLLWQSLLLLVPQTRKDTPRLPDRIWWTMQDLKDFLPTLTKLTSPGSFLTAACHSVLRFFAAPLSGSCLMSFVSFTFAGETSNIIWTTVNTDKYTPYRNTHIQSRFLLCLLWTFLLFWCLQTIWHLTLGWRYLQSSCDSCNTGLQQRRLHDSTGCTISAQKPN